MDTLAAIAISEFAAVPVRPGGNFHRERKAKRFAELNENLDDVAELLLKLSDTKIGVFHLATIDEEL